MEIKTKKEMNKIKIKREEGPSRNQT